MTERPTNTQPDKQPKAVPMAHKQAHSAPHEQKEEKKTEAAQAPEVKAPKKEEKKVKKEEASSKGEGLRASLKHTMYLSKFVKGKSIDQALTDLNDVLGFRRVVPFKGEIPHRSAPGVMSGRYPKAATKEFIRVLKNLKGNAIANGLELEQTRIYFASPSWAFRPARRGGRKAKRINLVVKAREIKENKNNG